MTEALIIEELIPHRDGMRLIDTVLAVDCDHAVTQATVAPDWPLVEDNGVSPIVLIELGAQTAGVCIGWQAKLDPDGMGGGPKGWLVGIKQAEFFIDRVPLHTCIVTRSESRLAVESYKEITATLHAGDKLIGRLHLQVLQAEKTRFSDVSAG